MNTQYRSCILLTVVAIVAIPCVVAQDSTPQVITFHGFLSDKSGGTSEPVTGPISMFFDIYDTESGGNLVTSVGPVLVDVREGFYDVELSLPMAAFSESQRYIEITVEGETLLPRARLGSAPFSYVADTVDGFEGAELEESAEIAGVAAEIGAIEGQVQSLDYQVASQGNQVDDLDARITTHETHPDAHPQYLKRSGDEFIGPLQTADCVRFEGAGPSDIVVDMCSDDSAHPDEGVTIRATTNPPDGTPILRVLSSGGVERLRVEHNGAVNTENALQVEGGPSYFLGTLGLGPRFATENPQTRLVADGTIRVRNFDNSSFRFDTLSGDDGTAWLRSCEAVPGVPCSDVSASDKPIRVEGSKVAINTLTGGNVGIGTNSPEVKLDVVGDARVSGAIESTAGGFKFPDGSEQESAVDGHSLDAAGGSPKDAVFVDDVGRVGIGTTSPTGNLEVQDPQTARIVVRGLGAALPASTAEFVADRTNAARAGGMRITDGVAQNDWWVGVGYAGGSASHDFIIDTNERIDDDPTGPLFYVNRSTETTSVKKLEVRGGSDTGAAMDIVPRCNFGVCQSPLRASVDGQPVFNVDISGIATKKGARLTLAETGGTGAVQLGTFVSSGMQVTAAGSMTLSTQGTPTVSISAFEDATNQARAWIAGDMLVSDAVGSIDSDSVVLTANYNNTGHGRVITPVLEITGGSDLSEHFDIRESGVAIEPGMVVSIDAESAGGLVVSNQPYDKSIAGVISGAGGVRPGVLMGQQGSVADGNVPVALTGRVMCWVDASSAEIEPGDLLTTSATPGHAMKAVDYDRAQGAIIGKAMTPLRKGTGLVLVLVSLQ